MEKREKLGTEIRFLGRILGEIIREQAGQTLYDLEEEIRLGSRARREGKPEAEHALQARIGSMNDTEARTVVRAFTIFFDLVNLAEDRERIRVLRERERAAIHKPRSESMRKRCFSCVAPAGPARSRGSWTSCRSASCSPRTRPRQSGGPSGPRCGSCASPWSFSTTKGFFRGSASAS